MAKRTFSIRKGFEYQDLHCAAKLLDLIELRDISAHFVIESDEVHHVDDLLLFPSSAPPTGHQIKFHVSRGDQISFASLCDHPTPKSRSLLQKLFRGWQELSQLGDKSCRIEFITTSQFDNQPSEVGQAIETATDRLANSFFTESRFQQKRELLCKDLSVSDEVLRQFLNDVVWVISSPSLDTLRTRAIAQMRRIGFPSNQAAYLLFMDVVGYYAENVRDRTSIGKFLLDLATVPQFREACEQRFPELVIASQARIRATKLRIATVDLQGLHAFASHDCACLDEPAILEDYRRGTSVPELSGLCDDQRDTWFREHKAWLRNRLLRTLEHVARFQPDLLVLPRFLVDSDVAFEILDWCNDNSCNVSLGGDYAPAVLSAGEHLETLYNVRVADFTPIDGEPEITPVSDVIFRPGRAGRGSISILQTPYSKKSRLISAIRPVELMVRTGVLTTVALSSTAAVDQFVASGIPTPQLVVASGGPFADDITTRLRDLEQFSGVVVVRSNAAPGQRSEIGILSSDDETAISPRMWEGVNIADITYEFGGVSAWKAGISVVAELPIVYQQEVGDGADLTEWLADLRGVDSSVSMAKYLISHSTGYSPSDLAIVLPGEDPDNFFIRRLADARIYLRELLGDLPLEQIQSVTAVIAEIEKTKKLLETVRVVPYDNSIATVPQRTRWRRSLVDRSDETKALSALADGTSSKRIMVLRGPTGIGKNAIIEQVRGTAMNANGWVEMHCIEKSTFSEFVGLLLLRLGFEATAVPSELTAAYKLICDVLNQNTCPLLILQDAQYLPLSNDDPGHHELLDFLSLFVNGSCKATRLLLTSTRRGNLQDMSGSHLLDDIHLRGLQPPDTLRLLQELVTEVGGIEATTQELEDLAGKIHGFPGLAEIAISLLKSISITELLGGIHNRPEVKRYIIRHLLGRGDLNANELHFLQYASMFRLPVAATAFIRVSGAYGRSIIADLTDRLLLSETNGLIEVNPLIADHFRSSLPKGPDSRRLHKLAYEYLESLSLARRLHLEEAAERIYHGIEAGVHIDLRDFELFTGPARRAMLNALKAREWEQLEKTASIILDVIPKDPVATLAHAIALDATGRTVLDSSYSDALTRLDIGDIWVGVELARSCIRRHDFTRAQSILRILETRYGQRNVILLAQAQLAERDANVMLAIDICTHVISDGKSHASDIHSAALVLRRANRFEPIIAHFESAERPIEDDRLRRQYAYACVVTDHNRMRGLQILEQVWTDNPKDGRAVADFASAIAKIGDIERALQLFSESLKNHEIENREAVLEEYALVLSHEGNHKRANHFYRELHTMRPHFHHISRRYARSLFMEAKDAKDQGDFAVETASVEESVRVLDGLMQMAPSDEWAQYFHQIVNARDYSAPHLIPSQQ